MAVAGAGQDRAPLLGEEAYTEIPVCLEGAGVSGHGGGAGVDWAGHCHWKALSEPANAVPQLIMAVVLCCIFMVCELVGGYIAGSLAIMCDAAHLMSDCGGFGLALLAFQLADRPTDARLTYGYRRAEVLGAMTSVLLIWLLTGVFVYVACVRLYAGDYDIDPDTMMCVSGAGVLINILMALVLHGSCTGIAHHHSHGGSHAHAHKHTSHGRTRDEAKFYRGDRDWRSNGSLSLSNGDLTLRDFAVSEAEYNGMRGGAARGAGPAKSINLRAALMHVLGDLIQSCGVFLASLIIKFYPSAKMVDPICTFVFSIVVLTTTVQVMRDALAVLMQAVPAHFSYRECLSSLRGVAGVRAVHDLHVWALSTHHTVLTAHVAIDEYADWETVLRRCMSAARQHGAATATFQVERYQPSMALCDTCTRQPGTTST